MKFITLVLSLSISFALANASEAAPPSHAVIFLPGYLGSFLRDPAADVRLYVDIDSIFGNYGTLSLNQSTLMTPPGPNLVLDGVVDYVSAVVTQVNVYGSMIAQLKTLPGVQVLPFAWDWRKDPFEAVQALGALIDKLRSQGVNTIDLVGHSGGGWLASYYMAYGTQSPDSAQLNWAGAKNLHRVVMLGTPYKGGIALFREMERGSTLPLMGNILPAETMASFPSIYCCMPHDTGHFIDQNGKDLAIALGDMAEWRKYKFGLLNRTDLPASVMSARDSFTESSLAACDKFLTLLQMGGKAATAIPSDLAVLTITGVGTQTIDKAFLVQQNGETSLFFDTDYPADYGLPAKLMYSDGDGTVPVSSAALPAVLKPNVRSLLAHGVSHFSLTADPTVQSYVLAFLKE